MNLTLIKSDWGNLTRTTYIKVKRKKEANNRLTLLISVHEQIAEQKER